MNECGGSSEIGSSAEGGIEWMDGCGNVEVFLGSKVVVVVVVVWAGVVSPVQQPLSLALVNLHFRCHYNVVGVFSCN